MEAEKLAGDLTPDKVGGENPENPEEGETSEEETPDSEQETEEKKPEVVEEKKVTQKELDKVYARMKLAEEKAKKVEAQLAEKPKPESISNIDAIVEVQQATKGLSPEEIAELRIRASANTTSLLEARKDENFTLWQKAYKEKVAKELKAPLPSSSLAVGKSEKDIRTMSPEEHRELEEKVKKKTGRQME